MNEKYITEKIAFYKLWLTFFITIDASITAWFFNNASKIGLVRLILATITIFTVTGLLFEIT